MILEKKTDEDLDRDFNEYCIISALHGLLPGVSLE
jgi:hypothetical protein